jgi:hypothetical protein
MDKETRQKMNSKLQDFEEYVDKKYREEGVDNNEAKRLREEYEHIRDEEDE